MRTAPIVRDNLHNTDDPPLIDAPREEPPLFRRLLRGIHGASPSPRGKFPITFHSISLTPRPQIFSTRAWARRLGTSAFPSPGWPEIRLVGLSAPDTGQIKASRDAKSGAFQLEHGLGINSILLATWQRVFRLAKSLTREPLFNFIDLRQAIRRVLRE